MNSLERTLSRALTVQELIDELESLKEQYGEDTKVAFQYTANDYWKTQIAAAVTGVESCHVSNSDYHKCLKVEDDELEEGLSVEIISLTRW